MNPILLAALTGGLALSSTLSGAALVVALTGRRSAACKARRVAVATVDQVVGSRLGRLEARLGQLESADRTTVHLFNRHGWLDGRLVVPEPDILPIDRYREGRGPSDAA